ncbi:MAG: ABC transporter ATP-binding protein [Eubacteriales bacterium]|nr:ABC transporter ATP-binding protein [Eubacteriales bacterium]
MIEVRNLVKLYGKHKAVDHLNFRIEKGHIYGLLGPNGAGKSTTMNIMTGYLGATEGTVLIQGHDILKEPESAKKCIGYLPEQPPVYMEMMVLEYLRFVAEMKKIPKKERKDQIDEVIAMAGLGEVENRLIQNLSKGYRQRVGLAQAILGFPEIIILDEPTVGLDPKQIIEIRELIRRLARKHTIILSSHILAEVREVCDYIMIISDGKLVAGDTPENLEKGLRGSRHIELQAKAPVLNVQEILDELPGIRNVEYKKESNLLTTARIETRDARDIREQIFTAFARKNIPLVTLKLSQTTLEEVFLELTQGKQVIPLTAEKEMEVETDGGGI